MKAPLSTYRHPFSAGRAPIRDRWTARPPGVSDEAIAGAMLRAAAMVRPFGPRELARVGARLRSKERVRPRPLLLQVAIAAAFMLFASVLSAAVSQVLRARSQEKRERETPVAPATRKPARHALRGTARPVAPMPLPSPLVQPLPATALPTTRPAGLGPKYAAAPRSRPVAVTAFLAGKSPPTPPPVSVPSRAAVPLHRAVAPDERVDPFEPQPDARSQGAEPPPSAAASPFMDSTPDLRPSPPPPAVPSSLARESRLLARAIDKLRREGDAREALAILDQHRTEFSARGVLAPEATATRIEALLRLGRHDEALALLDAQTPSSTGTGREMLVARAELRADRGRRRSALQDFDSLLRVDAPADGVTERALYGRAVCHEKMGRWDLAKADLDRYLDIFPHGRFAAKVRVAMNPWKF